MYFVSTDAGAQVAIILLAYGPCVVIVNLLGQVDGLSTDTPDLRRHRLCPIFMSGVGLPDIHEYSAG